MPNPEAAAAVDAARSRRRRSLLTIGNSKLGPMIGAWSLPAGDSCPGLTRACWSVCYAKRYTRRLSIDYSVNREASLEPGFQAKMVAECSMFSVVRIHVSGDFSNEKYLDDWMGIMMRCPRTTFYAYTRSWRIPGMVAKLVSAQRLLPNFRLLWSCDRESGIAPWMNSERDVAWMAMSDEDLPPRPVKVVFRHRQSTVMARMNGSVVCPAENGVENSVTCQRCRICFKETFERR